MKHPVVHPDGESFERRAVVERDKGEDLVFYPNRALKAIIEREIERSKDEGSLRDYLRRIKERVQSDFGKLVHLSILPYGEHRPLPDSFYCPITLELVNIPVIDDPDGNTYEAAAIKNWIRANGKSPVTRNTLALDQLRENAAVFDLMELEKGRSDASIHPSIRRWKDDTRANEPSGQLAEESYPATQAEIDARVNKLPAGVVFGIIFLIFVLLLRLMSIPILLVFFVLGSCVVGACSLVQVREEEQN